MLKRSNLIGHSILFSILGTGDPKVSRQQIHQHYLEQMDITECQRRCIFDGKEKLVCSIFG